MLGKITKTFSSSDKEKETLTEAAQNHSIATSSSPPPSYDQENALRPPDITAGFSNLTLTVHPASHLPSPDECIAHLKVLGCFYRLHQSVASLDGLYGILNSSVTGQYAATDTNESELLAKLAEKRWAIFVQRAVHRFETWWSAMTPTACMAKQSTLTKDGPKGKLFESVNLTAPPVRLSRDNIPPADILMVWHAFRLNPRAYLEDCLRYGRMEFWFVRFPWRAVSDSINSDTFVFEVTAQAETSFTTLTGLSWDSLQDESDKIQACPVCNHLNRVPGTTCFEITTPHVPLSESIDIMLSGGHGYCDRDFQAQCQRCRSAITHDALEVAKFRNDVHLLLNADVPLRGTLYGQEGIPWSAFGVKDGLMSYNNASPNSIFKSGLGNMILANNRSNGMEVQAISKMQHIRDLIQRAMLDTKFAKRAGLKHSRHWSPLERRAIRRLMSRYWNNSSSFALDLVGAVIRQGSFIEKMHSIDWLHSPALPNTMARLITKYDRFLTIMSEYPQNMAVPTLDVDLAWHTHQLSPYSYMYVTVDRTRRFIDHDDKVSEIRLHDAFAWTSKTYQKTYSEPYSECTCWYCEAVRESHTSTASRLFNSSARVAEQLHAPNGDDDPRRSAHISAHNAVQPSDASGVYQISAQAKADQLEAHYRKACERARKKGRRAPERNDYYYSDAYGYPVYIPAYCPYFGAVPYVPAYYPVTPGCLAFSPGDVGNCCSGTCSAFVAGGGCGSAVGGGCGGGKAGGCGGGCCSGGGGGGCSGGGGGGGCGGGCGGG